MAAVTARLRKEWGQRKTPLPLVAITERGQTIRPRPLLARRGETSSFLLLAKEGVGVVNSYETLEVFARVSRRRNHTSNQWERVEARRSVGNPARDLALSQTWASERSELLSNRRRFLAPACGKGSHKLETRGMGPRRITLTCGPCGGAGRAARFRQTTPASERKVPGRRQAQQTG